MGFWLLWILLEGLGSGIRGRGVWLGSMGLRGERGRGMG